MVDTNLNKKGRDKANVEYRGINLSEYIADVISGLENDTTTIFYGDQKSILAEPREESEKRLLNPSW
jgi:hypothetical protein